MISGHRFAHLLTANVTVIADTWCNWRAAPQGIIWSSKNKKTVLLVGWANMQLKSCFICYCPHKELKHSESAEEIELLCYYHNGAITFGKRTVSSVQTFGISFQSPGLLNLIKRDLSNAVWFISSSNLESCNSCDESEQFRKNNLQSDLRQKNFA